MRIPLLVLLAAVVSVTGCRHRTAVSTDALPLKKVVVYRNGVAYFERAGEVDSEKVEFQVRPEHVGDFLATLSVVEAGGSSVRSASFPLKLDEEAQPPEQVDDAYEAQTVFKSTLKTVVLELDGKKHDLRVGYVSEQPVWRPSYRLVFGEQGTPVLQAWGIVQNISGEDWKDVTLSLVAGAPIAFESTLATPTTPRRPVVSDNGELISAVPRGENTYAPPPPPPPAVAMPAPEPAPDYDEEERSDSRRAEKKKAPGRRPAPGAPPKQDYSTPRPPASAPPPSSMPRDLALLASTQVQAGTTRYDLPQPVTIPDNSATMVLLLAKPVPGEAVFMFAPNGGVPDSSKHPFRVVRFTNDTPGLLERGPIAVIESGAFLGQGVLEPLAAGGEATVPFALERSLAVDRDQKNEQQSARLARIEASVLTIERDQVVKTTYRLRNGQDKAAKVVLRHARHQGLRLHSAPSGTEDRVGQNSALVPANLGPHAQAEVTVDERRAYQTTADWMSDWAKEAIEGYIADKRADPKLVAALKNVLAVREDRLKTLEALSKVNSEKNIISNAAYETRENLSSLKRNSGKAVDELRQKLAVRLSELDRRSAELLEKSTELTLKENELRIRFQDLIRELKLDAPLPAPTA